MPKHRDEVEILRKQTRQYILDNPFVIRLVPHTETINGAGGRERVRGVPRPPQIVRLLPIDRQRSSTRSIEGSGSLQIEVVYRLMGDSDLQIARYDRFVGPDGAEYEVGEVQPPATSPYVRRADVYGIPAREQA